MAVDVERARRRFTIEEYEKMAATGILAQDDRVELIDGEIVEMSPIGDPHAAVVTNLTHLLVSRLGERARVTGAGTGPRAAALQTSAGPRAPARALVHA